MILRLLILILFASCASVPKHSQLAFDESHPSCVIKEEDLELPIILQTKNILTTGIASTGSIAVTTLGLASDVIVVGTTAIIISPACQYGCGTAPEQVIAGLESAGLLWSTKRAFVYTESWRCPYVDHISKALRKSARCNFKQGQLVAANELLGIARSNETLKVCASDFEKYEVELLTQKFKGDL